jgi:hypothetical protein
MFIKLIELVILLSIFILSPGIITACSPESPGRHLLFSLFGLCEPRTSHLRHDVASSFDIGFPWRVEQFALPILLRDVTVFLP